MKRVAFLALVCVVSTCTCRVGPPIKPVYPDADACGVDERITEGRLIRTEDGSALYIPCDAGAE